MSSGHRFTTLDGIRGVAALSVMFYHYAQHNVGRQLLPTAALAVDLFFCLSGFVIAYSYGHKLESGMSIKQYAMKRLIRLYPMFLIGLSIGSVALYLKVHNSETNLTHINLVTSILCNAFYIPYFNDFYIQIGSSKIPSAIFPTNDPAWSLFFELTINLVFAVFFLLPRKFRNPFLLAFLGGLFFYIYVKVTWIRYPGWGELNFFGGFLRTTFSFFAGVSIYALYDRLKIYVPKINPFFILLTTVSIFIIAKSRHEWLICVFVIIPALVTLGSVSIVKNKLTKSILDYLGWLSYPLYCVHFPILSIFSTLHHGNANYIDVFVLAFISIIVAHVTAKFIDEPIRKSLIATTSKKLATSNSG